MAKTDESQKVVQKSEDELDPGMRALGMIETRGLVACIEAADAMIKASNITLLDLRAIGAGYMTVMVRGDVGAVRTAIEAGSQAARRLGEVVSVRILPSPHLDLENLLPVSL
ncbi:MAG: BMC domain-containing protein [Anaerolineaceae bacterium]|jgi:microcompartment protein CcmL/EutN